MRTLARYDLVLLFCIFGIVCLITLSCGCVLRFVLLLFFINLGTIHQTKFASMKIDHHPHLQNRIKIRSYEQEIDKSRLEDLEQSCGVGPAESTFVFNTDTLGDPICRIRNSPLYKMLVAELDNEIVGVIQGTIKIVTVSCSTSSTKTIRATVGYILGLRVSFVHRRRGIGKSLVRSLEEWFIAKNADYAYMATAKDNEASVKLFIDKLGFVQFRTPAVLVNPVRHHAAASISPSVEIVKLTIEQAENFYRRFMSSSDFFPHDIDAILKNKLSLGTWIAYQRGAHDDEEEFRFNGVLEPLMNTSNWAMVSVWNSGELFKLRVGRAPIYFHIYAKFSRFIDRIFPSLKIPAIPDIFNPFGFYFMYGLHCEGPKSGELMRSLCMFVHNMAATKRSKDCKLIVTEVGELDTILRLHIPHSKPLSCPEDLWCIKSLRTHDKEKNSTLFELTKSQPPISLFVDPREV